LRNFIADFGVVCREMPKSFLFVLLSPNCLNPWDGFVEDGYASLRHLLLAMTVESTGNAFLAKDRTVHEQVPNTNIKFICPKPSDGKL
jgi:hypothetical protein